MTPHDLLLWNIGLGLLAWLVLALSIGEHWLEGVVSGFVLVFNATLVVWAIYVIAHFVGKYW